MHSSASLPVLHGGPLTCKKHRPRSSGTTLASLSSSGADPQPSVEGRLGERNACPVRPRTCLLPKGSIGGVGMFSAHVPWRVTDMGFASPTSPVNLRFSPSFPQFVTYTCRPSIALERRRQPPSETSPYRGPPPISFPGCSSSGSRRSSKWATRDRWNLTARYFRMKENGRGADLRRSVGPNSRPPSSHGEPPQRGLMLSTSQLNTFRSQTSL